MIRDYWQNRATPAFAHLDYHKYLHGENHLMEHWKNTWLNRWTANNTLFGKRVGDYGIGAGLLGSMLCKKYSVAHYVGIDVASRQLEAAAARLDKLPNCNRTLILQTNKFDFGSLCLDVLICQQVIQHFPSQQYLDAWLSAIDEARITRVFLEIRYAEPSRFSNWTSININATTASARTLDRLDRAVLLAVRTNCRYISERMPRYHLDDAWITKPGHEGSQFQGCALSSLRV